MQGGHGTHDPSGTGDGPDAGAVPRGVRIGVAVSRALLLLPVALVAWPVLDPAPHSTRAFVGLLAAFALGAWLPAYVLPVGAASASRVVDGVLVTPVLFGTRRVRLDALVRVRGGELLGQYVVTTMAWLSVRDSLGGRVVLVRSGRRDFPAEVLDGVLDLYDERLDRVSLGARDVLGVLGGYRWPTLLALVRTVAVTAVALAVMVVYVGLALAPR